MELHKDEPLSLQQQDMLQRDALEIYKEQLKKHKEYERKAITARKLAKQAIDENKWIYHPGGKQWFSPEEFMIEYGRVFPNHEILKQMQVRDPIDGIEAGFIRVSELQEKILSFARKIVNYYRNRGNNGGTPPMIA